MYLFVIWHVLLWFISEMTWTWYTSLKTAKKNLENKKLISWLADYVQSESIKDLIMSVSAEQCQLPTWMKAALPNASPNLIVITLIIKCFAKRELHFLFTAFFYYLMGNRYSWVDFLKLFFNWNFTKLIKELI